MKLETALKVQAWVDGELPPEETQSVARLVETDLAAAELATELRQTRRAVHGNELPRKVSDSREFYWSQIQRRIDAQEKAADSHPAKRSIAWWLRVLVPAGTLAALALVFAPSLLKSRQAVIPTGSSVAESTLDDSSSITFRSDAEGMTVVWVTSN